VLLLLSTFAFAFLQVLFSKASGILPFPSSKHHGSSWWRARSSHRILWEDVCGEWVVRFPYPTLTIIERAKIGEDHDMIDNVRIMSSGIFLEYVISSRCKRPCCWSHAHYRPLQ
jgi:hypothetical protein